MTIVDTANVEKDSNWYYIDGRPYVRVTGPCKLADESDGLVAGARKIATETALFRFPEWSHLIWAGRMEEARMAASRAAKEVWDTKRDLGTAVHAAIESTHAMPQQELILEPEVEPYVTQYRKWLATSGEKVLHSEALLVSDRYGFAGTADLITDRGIRDLKSGSLRHHFELQLNAYANADYMLIDGERSDMPEIHELGILDVKPENCELVPVNYHLDIFGVFLSALDVWQWLKAKS